ncbi:MAG: hypothetical protein RLY80_293 [Actinomycetota bacterium]
MSEIHNLVIVGSGPAGYTAAIYAARAQLNPLVYEGAITAGGALMNTTEVENFPGFTEGIMGPELMDSMRKQAKRFGANLITDDIVEMDLGGDVKTLKDGSGNVVKAKAVILATGSAYKEIGLENEKRLSGRGVSWCATCDGFFFRDQVIAVVGGGDSAMEEANFLTKFASKVVLIHRRDTLRASNRTIPRLNLYLTLKLPMYLVQIKSKRYNLRIQRPEKSPLVNSLVYLWRLVIHHAQSYLQDRFLWMAKVMFKLKDEVLAPT